MLWCESGISSVGLQSPVSLLCYMLNLPHQLVINLDYVLFWAGQVIQFKWKTAVCHWNQ